MSEPTLETLLKIVEQWQQAVREERRLFRGGLADYEMAKAWHAPVDAAIQQLWKVDATALKRAAQQHAEALRHELRNGATERWDGVTLLAAADFLAGVAPTGEQG